MPHPVPSLFFQDLPVFLHFGVYLFSILDLLIIL